MPVETKFLRLRQPVGAGPSNRRLVLVLCGWDRHRIFYVVMGIKSEKLKL